MVALKAVFFQHLLTSNHLDVDLLSLWNLFFLLSLSLLKNHYESLWTLAEDICDSFILRSAE